MDAQQLGSLKSELHRKREALFKEVTGAEAGLQFIAEDRESELEERAQEERIARLLARLDLQGKREIEEIDTALERIAGGMYGVCSGCERAIPVARLKALPATRFCVECARSQEIAPRAAQQAEVSEVESLPADMRLLNDRELERILHQAIREDGRIDTDELRVAFLRGVVHLAGAVPSEREHQILVKLVTDVIGMREVVDRLQVKEILWERDDRFKEGVQEEPPSRIEPSSTEDVVKSIEEGLGYVPSVGPVPEEEEG